MLCCVGVLKGGVKEELLDKKGYEPYEEQKWLLHDRLVYTRSVSILNYNDYKNILR